jgi:hypothetical protein
MKNLTMCLFLLSNIAIAQIKTQALTQLPKQVTYKGNIVQSLQWTDKAGENILVLTVTDDFKSKKQDPNNMDIVNYDKELYAYHYIKKGTAYELLWKITDFTRECPFDINVQFLEKAVAVTDLDKNGIAETWLMYRVACRSDVSPATQKLIMHEGELKYAIRGTTRISISPQESYGGEMTLDGNFKNGKQEFREYALKIWKENEKEFDN